MMMGAPGPVGLAAGRMRASKDNESVNPIAWERTAVTMGVVRVAGSVTLGTTAKAPSACQWSGPTQRQD